jgi:hypothetical protein
VFIGYLKLGRNSDKRLAESWRKLCGEDEKQAGDKLTRKFWKKIIK